MIRYTVVSSKKFRRQLKQLKRSGRPQTVSELEVVVDLLSNGAQLPPSAHNHKLSGKLADFYECHIEPDWLLMYRRYDDILVIELFATGTHSQLFG